MTAVIALALLVLVSLLLASGRALPLVVFALLPPMAALLLGVDLKALSAAVSSGLARTAPLATLFVSAICFTGIMRESGLYDPVLRWLNRLVGGSPVQLAVATVVLGMAAHLDGSGPTTFLMAIPVLLPAYDRIGARRSTLVMLLALAGGLFNLLPWGGPLGRASAVSGMELGMLWHSLLPAQLLGIPLLLGVAALAGWLEQRHLRLLPTPLHGIEVRSRMAAAGTADASLLPPAAGTHLHFPWHNALLCIALVSTLVADILPAWLLFLLALAIALPCNHRCVSEQRACLARHAPAALELASIVLAAGVLLGVLDGTGMLRALTGAVSQLAPPMLLACQHLLLAAVSTPLHLLLGTDAYYFVLLPVVLDSAAEHGADPAVVVRVMTLAQTLGGYVGPYSTAVWLALGMTGVDFATHVRRTLPWAWLYALMVLASAWLLGVW